MAQTSKLPPQNLEAEQSVLGALMIDKDAITKVADILMPEDFYKPAHTKIYEVIISLYSKLEPIDIVSVTNRLKESQTFQEVGGSTYLTHLIDGVPTSSHIEHYAKIVKEKKILRDLINVSAEITEEALNPEAGDIERQLDDIEQKVFSISQRSVAQNFSILKEELHEAYERIERLHQGEGRLRGVPTGFPGLDSLLSGLQRSDLIIIGARPSLGKTSLALDIARHVGVKEKLPVGIFSLEMSREQVIDRLIAAESNVALWKLRTGRLDETDFQMLQKGLDELSRAPIFIDDTPSPNILQMRAMARRLKAKYGLALLVVDYLQLIQPRTNFESMVQQITEVSRGLKALARELNIPILALSQLSRAADQREIKIPRLSDLRESGSIEQDSDVVLFIYRKDRDKPTLSDEPPLDETIENTAEIIIAKHRNGPLGTVKLKFDPDRVSFRAIDAVHSFQAV